MGNIPENARGRVGVLNRHLDKKDKVEGGSGKGVSGGEKRVSKEEWKIIYTYTDEAPLLATYSFLPIIKRFTEPYHINVETSDISVAHRVLALFNDRLRPEQRVSDTLQELGELTKDPRANIIKLPNVSASIPQLVACIKELQSKGYDIPSFPTTPSENPELSAKYAKILGSAVNPVLREGNSDRRVAPPVKANCKSNPHKMIKPFNNDSRSKVVHMSGGDFYESERSYIMPKATKVSFELVCSADNTVLKLREPLDLLEHEVIDASVLSVKQLRQFYRDELLNSEDNTLVSLHLKATMMKISDPIMFGHAVSLFYEPVFEKHAVLFQQLGINPNNGIGDVYAKLSAGTVPPEVRKQVEQDIAAVYKARPLLAMVNSAKGITNLHVPSDVIIDASMPVVIRDGGKMYGPDGELHDVKCLIPDRCYATMYKQAMEFCRINGAFDPATMGSVSNIGLMARKAEEYGSHDKTFEIPRDGVVVIKDMSTKKVIFEHKVEEGDIYRMCQAKDDAIVDWISLALKRGEVTGNPVIFWLDQKRAHDASLIDIINFSIKHMKTHAEWMIKAPEEAMQLTMERSKAGLDTISATGNVLRDYLTDLFPILELGTSAKMLSIVPLLAGGGLYETGAGGSAPKHAEQFIEEGHLRWDSLGEFLALSCSLTDYAHKSGNHQAEVIGDALMNAAGKLLEQRKSPKRKVKELDNRGSHFWLAYFWAQELASQRLDKKLAEDFAVLFAKLDASKDKIDNDLLSCQGTAQDIGGYYYPDPVKADKAMRPSPTLNDIIG